VTDERVTLTRRIAASPETIFAIVGSSQGHADLDGSGMLVGAIDPKPLTEVGQTFDMDMDRTPLNDIPGLKEYTVRNTVTKLEPNRLVEWTIGGVDTPPLGHVYGFELTPDGDGTTVTHYCDWSNIVEQLRASGREWPIVPVSMLEVSMDNLTRLAQEAARP
jgi:uncharacterized protein YndB with AHSA1/START domain